MNSSKASVTGGILDHCPPFHSFRIYVALAHSLRESLFGTIVVPAWIA
jgi:hypothetical protein